MLHAACCMVHGARSSHPYSQPSGLALALASSCQHDRKSSFSEALLMVHTAKGQCLTASAARHYSGTQQLVWLENAFNTCPCRDLGYRKPNGMHMAVGMQSPPKGWGLQVMTALLSFCSSLITSSRVSGQLRKQQCVLQQWVSSSSHCLQGIFVVSII